MLMVALSDSEIPKIPKTKCNLFSDSVCNRCCCSPNKVLIDDCGRGARATRWTVSLSYAIARLCEIAARTGREHARDC